MSYPNVDPKELFGEDLIQVFGPKAMRRHISTLTPQEKEEILNKVPEYVDTDDIGPRPSFFQITNKILLILQRSGALNGIDLDWCTDLRTGQLIRPNGVYISASSAYKNNKVQRGIWLQHLLRDILFEFNPSNVLMGLARKLSDGTYNINNSQHRSLAGIIVGVRDLPVEYIASDLESVDVDEYATDNLNTLPSSQYDDYRIRVRRNQVRKAEGRTDLDPKDCDREDMYDIHLQYGSRFIEDGTEKVGPLECTGVGNMVKYYDYYGSNIYKRAVAIVCTVFNKATFATANAWGIMEFIKVQEEQGVISSPELLDWTIQQSIQYKYSNPRKYGLHSDIKAAFNKWYEDHPEKFTKIPAEPKRIAAGIYKLCKIVNPEYEWEPIKVSGVDLVTTLKLFKVMPKQ
jgi:hypothetical protein